MRFLRLADVRSRTGLSRSQIYRKMPAGEFPKQYSLGARAVAWLESDIDAFIQGRIDAGPAPTVRLGLTISKRNEAVRLAKTSRSRIGERIASGASVIPAQAGEVMRGR